MRFITAAIATFLAVVAFVPTDSARAASYTWCLGLDNNKNLLSETDCPLVHAIETTFMGEAGLAISVETQSDVILEQFGIQWDGALQPDWEDFLGITIAGGSGTGDSDVLFDNTTDPPTFGSGDLLTWSLHTPSPSAQMDGFGNFDIVFDLDGTGSNHGIPSAAPGSDPTDAALWFFIVGGTLADFGVSFSPNCEEFVGCIQAAKISSEQLGYAGGYVSNVPLPGAVWLFLSALAGLFGIGYTRRSRAA